MRLFGLVSLLTSNSAGWFLTRRRCFVQINRNRLDADRLYDWVVRNFLEPHHSTLVVNCLL